MKIQYEQIKEISTISGRKVSADWSSLVLLNNDLTEKKIVGVRKLEVDDKMNSQSIMSFLANYFSLIEMDNMQSQNTICQCGCNDCCSADFEVSLVEFFAILNFIGVNYGETNIKRVAEQAKLSLNATSCIFVNQLSGKCDIYEVRPLICRKYGLYDNSTHCPKLDTESDLLPFDRNTGKNTLYFESSVHPGQPIMTKPKRIVQWFANLKDGEFSSQRMNDLFYASFEKNADEFVEILLK